MDLFPYQRTGAGFLAARKFAYLADEMRLGKSAQTIAALDALGVDFALVLCPAVARINWKREFEQFQKIPRSITVCLDKVGAENADRADVAVCSYDLAKHLPKMPAEVLVCDEAHYLKSTEAGRAKEVLGADGLIHSAKRAWFLSGTPAPNNPAEMWTVLYTCGVTKLTYEQFVERYCITRPSPYGPRITGGRNIAELRSLFDGFLLRRTKREVRPEMPPILFTEMVVEPGPVDIEVDFFFQWQAAGGAKGGDQAILAKVEKEQAAVGQSLAALESIAESVAMYRRYIGLQKVKPVMEMVANQLDNDPEAKIVLFAMHRHVIERLRDGLKDYGAQLIYGGTNPKRRQRHIDEFQRKAAARVLVVQIVAGGTAIALDAAHHALIVEADWVPGNNVQAASRLDGPRQKHQITVQFVSVAGSLDEQIHATLRRKAQTLSELFS